MTQLVTVAMESQAAAQIALGVGLISLATNMGGEPASPGNVKRLPNHLIDEETAAEIKGGIEGNPDLYYDPETGEIVVPRPDGGFEPTGYTIDDIPGFPNQDRNDVQ
jgi:hypothetical protein